MGRACGPVEGCPRFPAAPFRPWLPDCFPNCRGLTVQCHHVNGAAREVAQLGWDTQPGPALSRGLLPPSLSPAARWAFVRPRGVRGTWGPAQPRWAGARAGPWAHWGRSGGCRVLWAGAAGGLCTLHGLHAPSVVHCPSWRFHWLSSSDSGTVSLRTLQI